MTAAESPGRVAVRCGAGVTGVPQLAGVTIVLHLAGVTGIWPV